MGSVGGRGRGQEGKDTKLERTDGRLSLTATPVSHVPRSDRESSEGLRVTEGRMKVDAEDSRSQDLHVVH